MRLLIEMRVFILRPLAALLALVLISCSANSQCFFGSLDMHMGNSGGHAPMPAVPSMNDSDSGAMDEAGMQCSGHSATPEEHESNSSSADASCCFTNCGPADNAPAPLTVALKPGSARFLGKAASLLDGIARSPNWISSASLHADDAQSFLCVFRL
jgi:hypothetical protein